MSDIAQQRGDLLLISIDKRLLISIQVIEITIRLMIKNIWKGLNIKQNSQERGIRLLEQRE
jgi:hypothetical protein